MKMETMFGIHSGAKPKLCINCKHAHREVETWWCQVPQLGKSLVTGKPLPAQCKAQRSYEDTKACGSTAQWFEKGEENVNA